MSSWEMLLALHCGCWFHCSPLLLKSNRSRRWQRTYPSLSHVLEANAKFSPLTLCSLILWQKLYHLCCQELMLNVNKTDHNKCYFWCCLWWHWSPVQGFWWNFNENVFCYSLSSRGDTAFYFLKPLSSSRKCRCLILELLFLFVFQPLIWSDSALYEN